MTIYVNVACRKARAIGMTRSKHHRSGTIATRSRDKPGKRTTKITVGGIRKAGRIRKDGRWRSTIEGWEQPDHNKVQVLPEPIVDEIARITGIRPSMRIDFRASLDEIFWVAFIRGTIDGLSRVPTPAVHLNKIAETARKLLRYLMQLEQTNSFELNGVTHLVMPRVLLRAGLKGDEYANLISGLTNCADTAEAARLGVVRIETPAIQGSCPVIKARYANLLVLVCDLREVVCKAKGKLTLWRDPDSSEMRGTLPAVLNVLRPYIPDVIPKHISYRTLQRYHSFAAESADSV
jgi:hypothetical protein